MNTVYEFTLEIVDTAKKRFPVASFKGYNGLTNAHIRANQHGFDSQITWQEALDSKFEYAHIKEFRDNEHYNDIYLDIIKPLPVS